VLLIRVGFKADPDSDPGSQTTYADPDPDPGQTLPSQKIEFYMCRDPSRHFSFQSRRLLTKIFKSEVIGNWKCRCCEVKGEGHKTGVAECVVCLSPP
jgi:hypothetical protein